MTHSNLKIFLYTCSVIVGLMMFAALCSTLIIHYIILSDPQCSEKSEEVVLSRNRNKQLLVRYHGGPARWNKEQLKGPNSSQAKAQEQVKRKNKRGTVWLATG